MAKAIDVAKYIIYLKNQDLDNGIHYSLSNLKLQSLLYYCQGAHYRWDQERLITDKYFRMSSPMYGLKIDSVYKFFAKYGQVDVNVTEKEIKKIKLTDNEKETIESVWLQLRHNHPFTLVQSVKNSDPFLESVRREEVFISEESIRNNFENKD